MPYRRMVTRSAGALVLVVAGAVVPVAGCGGSDDTNNGTNNANGGGNAGSSGSGASNAGGSANGGGTSANGGSGTSGAGGASGGSGASGASGAGGGTVTPAPTQDPTTNKWMCTDATGTHVCACNDGIDNDHDQTIDAVDPNCAAGPFTDSEAGTDAGSGCGTTQCSNCIDDDGDGNIDGADIECTGALDNSEASFATGISGDNSDACKQDCFFDGNSGSGNDGCLWNLKCDSKNPGALAEKPCPYDASYKNCAPQTQACIDYCAQYTPNGCDCFGCCTVFVNGTPHDVKLSPTCSAATIDDPSACPACTKETSCANDCGTCEYCLGRAPDPSCTPPPRDGGSPPPRDGGSTGNRDGSTPPPPVGQCPSGIAACTPGNSAACPAGYYCLTGCCVPPVH